MINKKLGLIALLASVTAGGVMAGTFTNYVTGDVIIGFNGGSSDLIVDAGSITNFTSLGSNTRYVITNQITTPFTDGSLSLNRLPWCAFTYLANNTLYVTKARTSLNTPVGAWPCEASGAQYNTAQFMAAIVPGAANNYVEVYNSDSTPTAVVEADGSTYSSYASYYPSGLPYSQVVDGAAQGQFDNTFVGNPENVTPSNFKTAGKVVRSDFFAMAPTSSYGVLGTWLGYFELNTNGVLTYVAYPSSTPTLTVSRVGTTSTINYTTGLYGTYSLRYTNNIVSGVSATNWPVLSTLTSGSTTSGTYTDTTTDSIRFYTITAQ